MGSLVQPNINHLTSVAEFEKFLGSSETSVVGLFQEDTQLKEVFMEYASEMCDKIRIGYSNTASVLRKLGEKDAIVIYRAPQFHNEFEPNFVRFTGNSFDELVNFVMTNYHGLVGLRTKKSFREFEPPYVVAIYEVDYALHPIPTNYWRNFILEVAKEFDGVMKFAVSPLEEFQGEIEHFGVIYNGEEPLVIARNEKGQKFVMEEAFSVENLRNFVKNMFSGKLEPRLLSEPIPESNDGPVKIVVGKTFKELVIDNRRDTLLQIYAPWCTHCEKLEPIFEAVARKLRDEKVVFAKVNGVANDLPEEFDYDRFPYIYWIPKHSKSEPQKYEGPREEDEIIKFIAKEATYGLKKFDREGNKMNSKVDRHGSAQEVSRKMKERGW